MTASRKVRVAANAARKARAILEEVRVESLRRQPHGPGLLSPKEEADLRAWEIARNTEAIRLDPTCAEAYVGRGMQLYFTRRRAESRADMRKALALHPKNPELYHSMAAPFHGGAKRRILRAGLRLANSGSFNHEQLYQYFIMSYWYDGNFSKYVRLIEAWLPHLRPSSFMYRHELESLAMGYSALGRHADAEAAYRRALAAPTCKRRWAVDPRIVNRYTAEMIVRTRMHRRAYTQARAALEEFRSDIPTDRRTLFAAALAVLAAPRALATRAACKAALAVAERLGKGRGPTGKRTSYNSFLQGLVRLGSGRRKAAAELLHRFARESAANPTEWGVTMRWEIATVRRLAVRGRSLRARRGRRRSSTRA